MCAITVGLDEYDLCVCVCACGSLSVCVHTHTDTHTYFHRFLGEWLSVHGFFFSSFFYECLFQTGNSKAPKCEHHSLSFFVSSCTGDQVLKSSSTRFLYGASSLIPFLPLSLPFLAPLGKGSPASESPSSLGQSHQHPRRPPALF